MPFNLPDTALKSAWPHMAELSIRICYPFAFSAPLSLSAWEGMLGYSLSDLAKQWPVSQSLRERLENKSDVMIWEKFERPLLPDLYPHVRRLLGGGDGSKSVGSVCYRLTEPARQLLDGEFGKNGKGLELLLTNAAAVRLGFAPKTRGNAEKHWLPFSFVRGSGKTKLSSPILHLFGSGVGFIEMEAAPHPDAKEELQAEWALEFAHAIAHLAPNAQALRWKDSGDDQNAHTTLENILESLLRPSGKPTEDSIEPLLSGRLFTFTCLRLAGSCEVEDARDVAFRCAHRQTTHYLPSEAFQLQGSFIPFDNIVHAMSTEGGAVVVTDGADGEQSVSFFRQYIGNVVKDGYWPLVLLAYMEYLKLVQMTGDVCREVDFHNPTKSDHQELEKFRQDILNFRLNYRFSQASQITHHNQFFNAWRNTLGCDSLLAELTADVSEVDDFLSYKIDESRLLQEKSADRFYTYFGIVAAAILFVTSLLGTNFIEFTGISIFSLSALWAILGGAGLAALLILARWWIDRSNS